MESRLRASTSGASSSRVTPRVQMDPMVRRRRQRPQEVKDSTMALCLWHIGKLDLADPFVTLSQLATTLNS